MRTSMYLVAACAALVAVYAAPAPEPNPDPQPSPVANPQPNPADDRPEIIEIIAPAASAQETLATLNLGAPGSELSERNKRTIGILRQLFPTLTQIIEKKVQQITSMVLTTFGPIFLKAFLGNRNGGGGGNTGGGGGTVELEDDDDDDDTESVTPSTTTTTTTTTEASTTESRRRKRALIYQPVLLMKVVMRTNLSLPRDGSAGARRPRAFIHITSSIQHHYSKLIDSYTFQNAIAEDQNSLLSGAESQQAEVRVAFGEGGQDQQAAASEDQQAAAQTNSASIDEITLDDADNNEENRNKRFLLGGGSQGGSGGGSGNFIFDIVRLVAGSSSGTGDSSQPPEGDDTNKGDNLTEGVPGPITRLFIIANRGIANLIQDLILRIAQTSERIVNFKARLITSII